MFIDHHVSSVFKSANMTDCCEVPITKLILDNIT